jgi:hypothetical protein
MGDKNIMALSFMDFEIPLLPALIKLSGKGKTTEVYPEVEKMVGLNPTDFPGRRPPAFGF